MDRSLLPAQLSLFSRPFSCPARARNRTPDTRHGTRRGAFTLIELIVVAAIVAILAALSLGALGFVNRKGAASRASTEVAALAAAIESYKLEFGGYPSSNNLYSELTGGGPTNTNKVFFEPPPGMVNTNVNPKVFRDPFGQPYNYDPQEPTRNVGFFDLWSVPPQARGEQDWIHN